MLQFTPRVAKAAAAGRPIRVFGEALRRHGLHVERGEFGAHMQVSLVNDGPFTIYLEM